MKKLVLFASFLPVGLMAQNIGIGTNSPNSKAILDINSTTKGVLLPSMTSAQRGSITSPPEGLTVYDTDQHLLYHFDGTGWRKVTNSTFWNNSTTRNAIYNLTDSIGIGTSIPTERLDVNGNIKSRSNIVSDNNVTATGTVSGGSLVSSGNLVTIGTSLLNGEITANSDLMINNAGATIQLRSGGVNKGFFQLSGDNVRTGTNSGNTNGRFIIRNNGTDRIAVESDGKLTTPVTGDNNSLIPLCYGVVNGNGILLRGTDNVTVEKVGPGDGTADNFFRIHCDGISATSIIAVTPDIEYKDQIAARCYLGGTARVYTYYSYWTFNPNNNNVTETRIYVKSGFSFIIYK